MLEVMMSLGVVVVSQSWLVFGNSLIIYVLFLLVSLYEGSFFTLKLILFILTLWLTGMMLMVIDKTLKTKDLLIILKLMSFSLCMAFYSETMIIFYLSFEVSVIPILLIIFGWGYQPDRVEAGVYMILYTVFFSLPLLIGIYFLEEGWFMFGTLKFLMFIMAFLVKMPMFGFHLWLPRAHVEAPVFGSMILAGVMLKLGGYGIIKISFLLGDNFYNYSSFVIIISILGGVMLSFICFIQSDVKMLIAYSSVVHMSIVVSGLLTLRETAMNGAIYLMIGHGLCSSGLFCILGLTYNRTLTRSLYLNKGIMTIMPMATLWWFLFCSSNLSFPPCLNLPGEIFLVLSILSWGNFMWLLLGMFGLVSSMYSIYLFSFTQQSQNTDYFSFSSFSLNESLVLFLHWIPLNLLILDLSLLAF